MSLTTWNATKLGTNSCLQRVARQLDDDDDDDNDNDEVDDEYHDDDVDGVDP